MKLNLARNRSLKNGMPQMHALTGWEIPITFEIVTQKIVDGDLVPDTKQVTFQGVWQPLKMQDLLFKDPAQRSWSWYWLHTYTNIGLDVGDKVIYNNVRYKVMSKKDYSLNNFYEYQLIEDFEDSNAD